MEDNKRALDDALIVCSLSDAETIIKRNPEVRSSLVIVTADDVLTPGEMIVVPKDEFKIYLFESEDG